MPKSKEGSIIDPYYAEGSFYAESGLGRDSKYKVEQVARLLVNQGSDLISKFHTIADVGCGNGETTMLFHNFIVERTTGDIEVNGYDVHPKMKEMKDSARVKFIHGDFCSSDTIYDLALLLDVIEHVPAPTEFLGLVAKRARWVVLHIPLDDSMLTWLRKHPKTNLKSPGHLLVLNPSSALNLLTVAGLRVKDYDFSPAFRAPSGRETILQKILYPARNALYRFSPYLLQRSLGGVSLTVFAQSPIAL